MNFDLPNVLQAVSFPDNNAQRRLDSLVGIDEIKGDLLVALRVAIHPAGIEAWTKAYPGSEAAVRLLLDRPQLFVLGGDVGTGKTELAETIGDALARCERADITLFSLSLAARGTGFVGEMTQRIVAAFDGVRSWGEKRKTQHGRRRSAGLLFIDEADAIAQSRESAQMHHEDRAGVNALIRGVDDLTRARVPVAILMATNRLDALDPAVRRRAANVFIFERPNDAQRRTLFEKILASFDIRAIRAICDATGKDENRLYGYTYSDIVQRLVPAAVLQAYSAERPLEPNDVLEATGRVAPTPPFSAEPT